MSALFSSLALRILITLISAVFVNFNGSTRHESEAIAPVVSLSVSIEQDSVETDEEEKDQNKKEKESKSVKISISDDGIKVESGDEKDAYILDKKGLKSLVEKGMKSIPDSIEFGIEIDDGKRFENVINKDYVKIFESIHVKDSELVQGDVVSILGGVKVDGKVRGDVVSILGDVCLRSGASVNGDVICVLGELCREDGASVRGQTVNVGGGKVIPVSGLFPPFGRGIFKLLSRLAFFLIGLLILLLVLYFIPERIDRAGKFAAASFLKSLGVGALVVFFGSALIILVAVIIGITIIGIPISILLVITYLVFLLVGYYVAAYALGKAICKKLKFGTDSIYVYGLVGLFLLAVFGIISAGLHIFPFISPLRVMFGVLRNFIAFIALLIGVGAFLLSKAGSLSPVRHLEGTDAE